MERTPLQNLLAGWPDDDSELVPPPTNQPSVKELELLCPIPDTERYFEQIASHCPRLDWNSDLEIIINGRRQKGTNIVKLVSAIYSPPPHRLKGDTDFVDELMDKKIFPAEMMEKASRIGSSWANLLFPYPFWADTTTWYERHWRYFENDDGSVLENTEPYINGLYCYDTESDSE
jgi:hypothetical protein